MQDVGQGGESANVKSNAEYIMDDVASEIMYQVEDATIPIRRQMRQEAYDAARDMPVIGDIMNVKQHVDFFCRFRKKKDVEEDIENVEASADGTNKEDKKIEYK